MAMRWRHMPRLLRPRGRAPTPRFFGKRDNTFEERVEGYGYKSVWAALFGRISVDVSSATSIPFIKFQTKHEVEAFKGWTVQSDMGNGGISSGSWTLKECSSPETIGQEEIEPKLTSLNENELLSAPEPLPYKQFGRLFGSVSSIPADAEWNTGNDPNRPGFCGVVTPTLDPPIQPKFYNVVEIRVRTNVRGFILNLRPTETGGYQEVSLHQTIVRVPNSGWNTIAIPYQRFQITTRGQARYLESGIADDEICGASLVVRSFDAVPWGENFTPKLRDFSLDVQWVRFVRRPTADVESLCLEQIKMDAKEEFAEWLDIWKNRAEMLKSAGIISDISDVLYFSDIQLDDVECEDDVNSIQNDIDQHGVDKQDTPWNILTEEEMTEIIDTLDILGENKEGEEQRSQE